MPIFCPQCGQQQAAEDARFCSRCGLQLAAIERYVATGNIQPSPPVEMGLEPPPKRSPRQKGLRQGGQILFVSVLLFPIFFTIAIASDGPGPLFVPFFLAFLGLMRMAYARLFQEPFVRGAHQPTISGERYGALPSYRPPIDASGSRGVTTGELQPPPSVTEHTTRFLDRER
jgi:hypothetical protein